MAYENQDDARTLRRNLYFNKSEDAILAEWARSQKSQKAALMRKRIVELAEADLKAIKVRNAMTALAVSELAKLG